MRKVRKREAKEVKERTKSNKINPKKTERKAKVRTE
jgi:hypothetical protein